MESRRTPLTDSQNGKAVWYDADNSHAATHIADTPNLESLAAEVIAQIDIGGEYMLLHKDLGRIVGTSDLVVNLPGDKIIYAKRLNRREYTAFNKTQPPQPSSLVTVAVEQRDDGTYELVSTWIGQSDAPSFPGTERETDDSREFWSQHALAWGRQAIQPGTETADYPW